MSKRRGLGRRQRLLKQIRYRSALSTPRDIAALRKASCPGPRTICPFEYRIPFDQHIAADIPDDEIIDITKRKLDKLEPATQDDKTIEPKGVKLSDEKPVEDNVNAQAECLLFKLPLELREQIYEKICIRQTFCIDSSKRRSLLPSLLQTCKTIYNDARQTYYRKTIFYSGSPEYLITWICSLSPHHINLLHTIRYDTFMQRPTTTMYDRGSRAHTIYHLNVLSLALFDKGITLPLGVVEGNCYDRNFKLHWVRSDQFDDYDAVYKPVYESGEEEELLLSS